MNILPFLARGVGMVAEAVDFFNIHQEDVPLNEGEQRVQTASKINRYVRASCFLTELTIMLRGGNSKTISNIKAVEFLSGMAECPIAVLREESHVRRHGGSFLQVIEQGFVLPLAEMLKSLSSHSFYAEKHFLEMSPEEQKKAQRPIYEMGFDCQINLTGYKPVDIAECKRNMKSLRKLYNRLTLVGVGAKLGVVSGARVAYDRLYEYLQEIHAAQRAANHIEDVAEEDQFNLVNLGIIPAPLHEDIVFRRYVCPITLLPIRHPVGDPNGHTLYERGAILQWLQLHHFSPITHLPLTPAMLIPKPGLQALIDNRLRFHQDRLWEYIQQAPDFQHNLDVINNQHLQDEANIENPHA